MKTVRAELTIVGDERTFEDIYCIAEVDETTNKVISIKYCNDGGFTEEQNFSYVEGLGAPGTAQHWLELMKKMFEHKNINTHTEEIWYEWEEHICE